MNKEYFRDLTAELLREAGRRGEIMAERLTVPREGDEFAERKRFVRQWHGNGADGSVGGSAVCLQLYMLAGVCITWRI